jgi:3-keto-5-aminohexanoate cleavage enzyme
MGTTNVIWEYTNQREWTRRWAHNELPPLIISVAITGGVVGKEANPNLPESPEEQARQTYDCYNAGASLVHIHRRSPENPAQTTSDPAHYRHVNALIRERCPDIIINNTTGGGEGVMKPEERLASLQANPEICSLNMGPLAFRGVLPKRKPPLTGRPDDVHLDTVMAVTYGETEMFAKAMLEKGIKPEMEVYHPGHWPLVHNLIDKGLVKPPYFIQFVMGFPSGIPPTPKNVIFMMETAPMPSVFSVLGVGAYQTAMVTMGIMLGLAVRTGMEDNLFYQRGELAKDNAQLVDRVIRIARELGREIATPQQARQMLGLSEKPSQY